MKKDDSKPATKKDLLRLESATKKDIRSLEVRLRKEMATKKDILESENRMVHQFKVIAENLVHDFNGIFKDRTEQHGDRITRLEQHTGLRPMVAV